jgi:Domain of unknown function (DUF222)
MSDEPLPADGASSEEPCGSALPGGQNGSDSAQETGNDGDAATRNEPHDRRPEHCENSDGRGPAEDADEEGIPPEEPEQGLFMCVPAGAVELSGFAGEGCAPPMTPGPVLATVAGAIAGSDGTGLAEVSEEYLFAMMSAARRMSSWATWLEFGAMRELALRRPATPRPVGKSRPAGSSATLPSNDGRVHFSEFTADEVAMELRMTWMTAADRMSYACNLAGRLPVTYAAMGAGLIDPVHAKIIYEQTDYLSAADAAKADPLLAAAAQVKTYGELRAAAAKLALKLDPEAAERRKQAGRKHEAQVRPFREDSGNAGMIAREMASEEVLASWQHIDQRARELRGAGVTGSLRELRVRAYLDLLQERDSRDALPGSDDGPGGNGGPGPQDGRPAGTGPQGQVRRGASGAGPSLAAVVNITVSLSTLLGESGAPGEAAGFGLLDAGTARDLTAAAARDPNTRWCVTAVHPDGTAAAHGCALGRHPPPPGPEPPGPEPPGPEPPGPGSSPGPPVTANLVTTCDTSGGPDQRPPPGTRARDYLRSLRVRLDPIARGTCDHRHAETGYQPSRKLRHLITTRNARCSAPGCGRPAARCDLDHTLAWHLGGASCECNLAPLCRHHHRCKQAEGWWLEQPEPGILKWRTPAGRTATSTPAEYSA